MGALRAPCIAQVESFLADAGSLAVERSAGAQVVAVRLETSPVGKAVDCGTREVAVPASRRQVQVAEVASAKALLAALQREGSSAAPRAPGAHTVKGVRFEGVVVPAGRFVMGSPSSESGRDSDEAQVKVTLTRPYEVMKTEVTQGLYRAVTGQNPSGFSSCGDGCPVEQVSWLEAVSFANALSSAEGRTPAYRVSGETVTWDRSADGWRLPTEAEWEYAARAGERTVYAGSDRVDEVGWYDGNSGGKTHPACGKRPNGWGLCDMTGNVWEWTWDWYASSLSGGTDPAGSASGSVRVSRGGSWYNVALIARVADRSYFSPGSRSRYLGFRLVRSLDPWVP